MYDMLGKFLKYVGFGFFIFFVGFLIYDFTFEGPKASLAQEKLELEFKSIDPLSGAVTVQYDTSHKPGNALVGSTYLTSANAKDIFSHYDQQLRKQGWQYSDNNSLTNWSGDLNGKSVYYCKGDYTASVEYEGQRVNYGWTYAFDVSWGLDGCKNESTGVGVKQNIPFSLFIIAFSLFFTASGGYYAYSAWTKTADEYLLWRRNQNNSKWADFWSLPVPKSYLLWNDRIISIIGMVMGLFILCLMVYSLWRNIFGS